jgi:hypothetical protein
VLLELAAILELILSVLHELCRYRAGCRAIASHHLFALKTLVLDPPTTAMVISESLIGLTSTLPVSGKEVAQRAPGSYRTPKGNEYRHPMSLGRPEQLRLDLFGRILNGLDTEQDAARRASVTKLVLEHEDFLPQMDRLDSFFAKKAVDLSVQAQFIKPGRTARALRANCDAVWAANRDGSPCKLPTWRTFYRMERATAAEMQQQLLDEAGRRDPALAKMLEECKVNSAKIRNALGIGHLGSTTLRRCSSCGKLPGPETPLKACSRCRSAYYCGGACQRGEDATSRRARTRAACRARVPRAHDCPSARPVGPSRSLCGVPLCAAHWPAHKHECVSHKLPSSTRTDPMSDKWTRQEP